MDHTENDNFLAPSATYIVEPTAQHRQTIILLHGLGSNGEKFGKDFLKTGRCSNGKTLADLLPGARFIFPTSARRRVKAFRRVKLTSWFNLKSLGDPNEDTDIQIAGLTESCAAIHDIIITEAQKVGASNIILGGLSQGCAVGLIALLSLQQPAIGGFFGMCGWLPLQGDLDEVAKLAPTEEASEGDNFFGVEEDADDAGLPTSQRVATFLRQLFSMTTATSTDPAARTPILLGHGDADEKIKFSLGEEAASTVASMGYPVTWKRYAGQGHWYKIPDQIDDFADFIYSTLGWWELAAAAQHRTTGRIITQSELDGAERFGEFCPVYKVAARTIVKTSGSTRVAAAESMKLVRRYTSIPVPEVHSVYTDDATGHVRIVMEFIEGDQLDKVWDGFCDEEKQAVIGQLRCHFEELRKIKSVFIGSVDGTACEGLLFEDRPGAYGPYQTEAAFNEGLIEALHDSDSGPWASMVFDMIRNIMKAHEIVLTHGDFDPRNILVQGSKVVAILDWELAGFYPDYWEYCKALRRPDWNSGWSKEKAVDRILRPCLKEPSVIWHTNEIAW